MPETFNHQHPLVVIGGGPGGYEAALAAAQLGAQVSLVERAGIGGAAVLTDVVPSKSLIAEGNRSARRPLTEVNEELLALAGSTSTDMRLRLEKAGVDIIDGEASFADAHRIQVVSSDGTTTTIDAATTVIATGASPRVLPDAAPDGKRILTWTQLYGLTELPEHLVVVGSGVTGAEFASAYRHLGSQVTLVSSRPHILPGQDADAAAVIELVFARNGITVHGNTRAIAAKATKNGVTVTLEDGTTITGTHCLIAAGAIPSTAQLGLERVGVETSPSGHIRTNRVARTSVPHIYAVGDCSLGLPLASVAARQGRTAAFHALGDTVEPFEPHHVPATIFTTPEVATVGYTEADIRTGLIRGTIHTVGLRPNPRAKIENITDGFVKLIATTTSRTVIGGVIVSPHASELIAIIALAVKARLTVDQLADMFPIFPSLSSTIVDAARALHAVRDLD